MRENQTSKALAEPMSASEARAYIPQWGSFVTNSDPGYIAYTAIPPEEPGHRDTMVDYLRGRCLPIALEEGGDPEGDEYEWSDVEQLHRAIAYLEALSY